MSSDLWRPIAAAYCDRASALLGSKLTAVWVQGSIALGDFDPATSDVDLISLVSEPVTPLRRLSLERVHRRVDGVVVSDVAQIGAVARWIARAHGIALFGPPPYELIPEVTEGELRREMQYNLEVYWTAKARRLDRMLFAEATDFAVQTLPRIIHTLETSEVISKRSALRLLEEARFAEWRPLVEDVRGRRLNRIHRALEVRRFIRAMVELGRTL